MWNSVKQFITDRLSDQTPTFGEHPMFYPGRDWKIILGTFVVINIIVAGLGVYMFLQVQRSAFFGSSGESGDTQQLQNIDRTKLTNVIEQYEQRRVNFTEYQQNPPEVFDPSE